MVARFGSREICDVTFKALVENQKVGNKNFKAGQPVFVIDTATASSVEQATSTVYAQGGIGYSRLIAWEGEKTVTFTVTDALMSPMGLAMLTGAGIADASETKPIHAHVTFDTVASKGSGNWTAEVDYDTLANELGITDGSAITVCADANIKTYATVLDGNGYIIDWVDAVTAPSAAINKGGKGTFTITSMPTDNLPTGATSAAVKLDFYVVMFDGATEIRIEPSSFGGFFYVEADTLYRNQDGVDMAATLTFPKVKIQSGFTLSMSPTGDPSELMRLAA